MTLPVSGTAAGRFLDRVLDIAATISRAGVWACGVLLFAAVAMIVAEIVLRLFGSSLHGAHELSGYVLAIVTSWGLAYALIEKAHIRIDVIYMRLSPRLRVVLDVVSILMMALFVIVLLSQVQELLAGTLRRGSTANTPLQTPLWIPQMLWMAGLVWFAFTVFVIAARTVLGAVTGERDAVARVWGNRSLEDEIAENDHSRPR
ncbi:C4-dicarboxylate ABC transporter permease [Tistrella bauzanensis]|uniref:TRAP transporter small permease protein n=1 Tax=Tistrella bauzanensis TaxID=657419 RepID=A0ABQ1IGB1_9PROT|nr:TRAP transporter small permease [Tistrella bauzanensis]GGB38864.1 C4-dicarboxylate ABC transporter permease [Tistrella bauzanensis]